MRSKKHQPSDQINAGSMADIAFLLLIFFLVATTIVEDKGILVKLPPMENFPDKIPPNKNVLSVKINAQNQLMVEGFPESIENLRKRTKHFILNPGGSKNLPLNPKRAIISLQNDRNTSYKTYLNIYNELKIAYNEIWEDKSQERYGKGYDELTKAQQKMIRREIPLLISEAEPSDFQSLK